ncbi:MAG: hypothetical protein H5T86_16435 [Armatimonadetes bacterium]|nr:hypothetical protein [Armatimonadota bacterium]
MRREHTIKLYMALEPEDVKAIFKVLGPSCLETPWFRRWLRYHGSDMPLSEYRALMEAPPRREPRPVRDWGDDE